VKQIPFAAGQTRQVRVRYGMRMGGYSTGEQEFVYRLDTGASWKGTIGKVDVVARFHGLPWYGTIRPETPGFIRKGQSFMWHWANLEPATGKSSPENKGIRDISISFVPGYQDIVIDGKLMSISSYIGVPRPILKNGEVWVPVALLAEWLGADVEWDGAQREAYLALKKCTVKSKPDAGGRIANLTLPAAAMRLRPGKREVMLMRAADGQFEVNSAQKQITWENGYQVYKLRHKPYLRGRHLFVPVNKIIILLGGTARFDKKTGVTYLTMPQAKPVK
jgi:hypothetical protein